MCLSILLDSLIFIIVIIIIIIIIIYYYYYISDHCVLLVAQIIPDRILQHLQLHQEEAQQIPLHLHCAQLRLPDIKKKGKFKVFKAPPPTFFTRTLAALGMGEYNYPS